MLRATVRRWIPLCLVFATLSTADGEDWSRFRGPNGSGVSTADALPRSFGEDALLWSSEIPFGRSSPAVGREIVFLTALEGEELTTLALSRKTGELLWKQSLPRPRKAEVHQATDSSTPSPVTDGENVFVFFQEFGLLAYDPAGHELWRLPLGPFRNYYGMSASPILVGDLVVLLCDQGGGSFLLAVRKDKGQEAWRAPRTKRRESYTTPVLFPDAARPQLVLVYGSRFLDAYDPESGELIWTLPGIGAGPVASPVVDGQRVYLVAPNFNEEPLEPFESLLEKHDADGSGELARAELAGTWMEGNFRWIDFDHDDSLSAQDWSELGTELAADSWGVHAVEIDDVRKTPKILWNYRKNVSYIPSLLAYDGIVFMVEESIVSALDAATGELLKRGRLETGKTYASPIAAGGEILFSQLDGKVSVVAAGAGWETTRQHDFGEEIHATPALTDKTLYLRTRSKLLAFATQALETEGKQEAAAPSTN